MLKAYQFSFPTPPTNRIRTCALQEIDEFVEKPYRGEEEEEEEEEEGGVAGKQEEDTKCIFLSMHQ